MLCQFCHSPPHFWHGWYKRCLVTVFFLGKSSPLLSSPPAVPPSESMFDSHKEILSPLRSAVISAWSSVWYIYSLYLSISWHRRWSLRRSNPDLSARPFCVDYWTKVLVIGLILQFLTLPLIYNLWLLGFSLWPLFLCFISADLHAISSRCWIEESDDVDKCVFWSRHHVYEK